jgi:hypothetical protein
MAPTKQTYRIYDNTTNRADIWPRVSTAVSLQDGSVLQVFPERRTFATLNDWRRTYPVVWVTRRRLTKAESEEYLRTHPRILAAPWDERLPPRVPIPREYEA